MWDSPMGPMESGSQEAAWVYEISLPCKGFRLDSPFSASTSFQITLNSLSFPFTMSPQTAIRHSRQYSLASTMDATPDKEERKREVFSFMTPLTCPKTDTATVQSPCTARFPCASQNHLPPPYLSMLTRMIRSSQKGASQEP